MIEKIYICVNFLRFWPHIIFLFISKNKSIIKEDLEAYKNEYNLNFCLIYLFVHLMTHNRSFRSLYYHRIGYFKWFCQWLGKGATELRIPMTAKIGSGLLLFHAYGTIFSSKCIVGNSCRVVHNVTIGDKKGLAPKIGNKVEIYANAVIAGDISIGDNCVIGPGAVVFKSIPANCVVVGNPAYILKKDGVVVNQKL